MSELPHEQGVQQGQQLADELDERSERLGDEIDSAREDWQAKKADPSVPGAPPDADDDVVSDDAPEADYPTKGPSD